MHLFIRKVFYFLILSILVLNFCYAQDFNTYQMGVFSTGQEQSSGASFIDYDQDGDVDLFVGNLAFQGAPANWKRNYLYRNEGNGNFVIITQGELVTDQISVYGHTWGDYDNDGDLDVYAAGDESYLYRNDGDDSFTKITDGLIGDGVANRAWGCAWADYDNDGYLDLVVVHAAGFIPGDPTTNKLYHNEGDGTFTLVDDTPITQDTSLYTTPTWADFDDDGDLDLSISIGPVGGEVSANGFYKNLLVETGTADFELWQSTPLTTDEGTAQTVNWVDIDNDLDLDVYVTNFSTTSTSYLYINNNGTFERKNDSPLEGDLGPSLASTFADYDNDGDLDVVVSSGAGQNSDVNRYFENDGNGNFSKRGDVGDLSSDSPKGTWGGTSGDIDGDGDLDLYIPNIGTLQLGFQNRFYVNELQNNNNWIKLFLEGDESNKSAIGSKVFLYAVVDGEPVSMRRDVSAQNTFGGHNSLQVHFGLGDAESIDSIRIHWPSGQTSIVENVQVNANLEVNENSGVTGIEDEELRTGFQLDQNYPNPFNPETKISYSIPAPSDVSLKIYDIMGKEVATLVDGFQQKTSGTVRWNAMNNLGQKVASGIYFYTLKTPNQVLTRKMMLIK